MSLRSCSDAAVCRAASNSTTPAATDTFRLSTAPGHRNRHQPVAALPDQPPQPVPLGARARSPSAACSRPRRSAPAPRRRVRPSRPPASFSSSSARAMLTTVAIRTCVHRARPTPWPTTPSSGAACRACRTTPCAAGRVARCAGSRRRCADPRCRRARRAAAASGAAPATSSSSRSPAARSTSATTPLVHAAARQLGRAPPRRRVSTGTPAVPAPAQSRPSTRRSARGPTRSLRTRPARSASSTGLRP